MSILVASDLDPIPNVRIRPLTSRSGFDQKGPDPNRIRFRNTGFNETAAQLLQRQYCPYGLKLTVVIPLLGNIFTIKL
jgi:hypothetical protein